MYGKLDEKMNRDDGVKISGHLGSLVYEFPLPPPLDHARAAFRLECLKLALAGNQRYGESTISVADEYAAFVLGEDSSGAIAADNDDLVNSLATIADVCRNAGV